MTIEQAQFMDQAAFWFSLIIGGGAIALIYLYERYSRDRTKPK